MNRNPKDTKRLTSRCERALNRWSVSLLTMLAMTVAGIAAAQPREDTIPGKEAGTERTVYLQEITTLSSMQVYTQFALIRNMLLGEWDEKIFQQFSLYDGVNLQMMRRYEKQLEGDKKWGLFLKMKNAQHQQVNDDLELLIRKKRKGEELTTTDVEKLANLDQLILDKLIK